MKPRPKGVVVYRSPENSLVAEAEKNQKQERLRLQTERAERADRRAERGVPNYICYSFLFPNYDPQTGKGCPRPLPKCRVCEGILHPQENHKCEGFTPKYVEHDDEWRERQEAKREYAREMRREQRVEYRAARLEMIREARENGELYGREDDGHEDDDGWECEDDGVYGDDDGWDCD
jgi:hypothetical protein